MPTQNVYFTEEQYSQMVYYALDHSIDVTAVIKLMIDEGLKTLQKEAKQ